MVAVLILAAGESSRMGSPKAMLVWGAMTFLEIVSSVAKTAGAGRVLVAVSRLNRELIVSKSMKDIGLVVNDAPSSDGQIASIRAAIREINESVEYLMVWPVDMPAVSVSTVSLLLDSCRTAAPKGIVLPVFRGKRGHPVAFHRDLFPELLDAPVSSGARHVVHHDPGRVLEVPVDDPAVLDDIDTPEDYQRLISSTKSLP